MNSMHLETRVPSLLANSNGELLITPSDGRFASGGFLSYMHIKHVTLALAVVALATVAFAQSVTNVQTSPSDVFQITYAANLNVGDSFINFTNSGATTSSSCDSDGTVCMDAPGIGVSQNLCINLYTFDPQEELISCCTCSVTPNGLVSLSVIKSLISNPLTPAIPTAV